MSIPRADEWLLEARTNPFSVELSVRIINDNALQRFQCRSAGTPGSFSRVYCLECCDLLFEFGIFCCPLF